MATSMVKCTLPFGSGIACNRTDIASSVSSQSSCALSPLSAVHTSRVRSEPPSAVLLLTTLGFICPSEDPPLSSQTSIGVVRYFAIPGELDESNYRLPAAIVIPSARMMVKRTFSDNQ